jgi:4-hydroxybenzoate polyprenyltransferase
MTEQHTPGLLRFIIGLLLTFGAVGGMEDPALADFLAAQLIVAVAGLALMFWATVAMNRHADRTIDHVRGLSRDITHDSYR